MNLAKSKGKETTRTALEQTFRQVRESVKSSKEKYPGKNELEIVKQMSENPLCSGLVQPLVASLKCSQYLAWAMILEQFSKPPP